MEKKGEKQVKEVATELLYKLDEKPPISKSIVYAFQWLLYSTGILLLVPVIIGPPLGLNSFEIAALSQRIFFYTGIASLLQVLFGHKLPLTEGSSGLWWALFVGLASTDSATSSSLEVLRSDLVMGMIVAGLVIILMGISGIFKHVIKLFTPVVTGSVLVLLTLELSKTYIRGALGVGYKGLPFSGFATISSLIIIAVVVLLTLKAKPIIRSLSVFIGLLLGWILYSAVGLADFSTLKNAKFLGLPTFFEWGIPTFNFGIVLTCTIAGVILISNVFASIIAVCRVSKIEVDEKIIMRGVIFNGIGNILGGITSTVGTIPYATAAGLVSLTGVASRLPFIFYSIMLILIGFIPAFGSLLATIPSPVGNAVAIVSMCTLFGFGIKDYMNLEFTNRDIFVLGIGIMTGVGIMFLPSTAIEAMPEWLGYILGNGMITGMIVVMLLEHVLLSKKFIIGDKSNKEIKETKNC